MVPAVDVSISDRGGRSSLAIVCGFEAAGLRGRHSQPRTLGRRLSTDYIALHAFTSGAIQQTILRGICVVRKAKVMPVEVESAIEFLSISMDRNMAES